jgi:hypothetical protein
VLAHKQTAAVIPQIPKIFPSFIPRISFCSRYYVVFVRRRIDCWAASTDAARKLRLMPLHGTCHCEKANETKGKRLGAAQTLLKRTGCAQILRTLLNCRITPTQANTINDIGG